MLGKRQRAQRISGLSGEKQHKGEDVSDSSTSTLTNNVFLEFLGTRVQVEINIRATPIRVLET